MMDNTKLLIIMVSNANEMEAILSRLDCTLLQYSDIVDLLDNDKNHSQTLPDGSIERICEEVNFEYVCENIEIDDYDKVATVNGKRLFLTYKEYFVLLTLLKNPNRCISRSELYSEVWGDEYHCNPENTKKLTTCISTTRKKIREIDESAAEMIVTEKGFGYRLSNEW
jgi:DNA-binding response OmpR family regulator